MKAVIRIKLRFDRTSMRHYWSVYFGSEFVVSHWHEAKAVYCANVLRDLSGAEIHQAEVVPFPKAVT